MPQILHALQKDAQQKPQKFPLYLSFKGMRS